MFVNELIKTYGYTRDKLTHFNISIFNPITDDWITIKHPTADEYIQLCDRQIIDWMIGEDETVEITVYSCPNDFENFTKYYKGGNNYA